MRKNLIKMKIKILKNKIKSPLKNEDKVARTVYLPLPFRRCRAGALLPKSVVYYTEDILPKQDS